MSQYNGACIERTLLYVPFQWDVHNQTHRGEGTMSLSLFSLQGRRALVTGSGQGIGLALAQGLGLAGASVVLNGRDLAKLDGAAEGLRARGIEVAVAAFDVTDHDAVVEGVGRI